MKTQEHTEPEEPTADADLWLDHYPVEVLEAALKILKAQHRKSSVEVDPVAMKPSDANPMFLQNSFADCKPRGFDNTRTRNRKI